MTQSVIKYILILIISYPISSIIYSAHASIYTSYNQSLANTYRRASYKPSELRRYLMERSERIANRRSTAHSKIAQVNPDVTTLQKLSKDDIQNVYNSAKKRDSDLFNSEHKWFRRMKWYNNNDDRSPYNIEYFADTGSEIDQWAQAYRMLGGFIDCDHNKDDSHDSGDDEEEGCSRWMMWAAYYNPNYNGGGRNEYFSYNGDDDFYNLNSGKYYDNVETDEPVSRLDCHSPETDWILVGVYRQEFYQFLEQISKHLWAIDEYEYVVALSGLAYMTDADCWQVGNTNDGSTLYAGIEPLSGGYFQISLYTDASCLYPRNDLELTFDDFGLTSSMNLGSGDGGNDDGYDDDIYSTLYEYWQQSQEYTLKLLNEVYDEYKYCTLCMDYPTYQDGYFNGNDGTEDDDLINQCWKFHSHDSFVCESDCLALADSQGTILEVKYGDTFFGEAWEGSTGDGIDTHYDHYKQVYTTDNIALKLQKLKANAFLCFSSILFFATFLAFAVTKGSRGSRNYMDDRSQSLLSNEIRGSERSISTRRSRSRRKADIESCKENSIDIKSPNHLPRRKRSNRRIKVKSSSHSGATISSSSKYSVKTNSRRKQREIDDF